MEKRELPVYEDIITKYEQSDEQVKKLLMELIIRRALADDKQLKKSLGRTYDNWRSDDGSVIHMMGVYCKSAMTEREADDMIVSNSSDIRKMWVIDKYSDLAKLLE